MGKKYIKSENGMKWLGHRCSRVYVDERCGVTTLTI